MIIRWVAKGLAALRFRVRLRTRLRRLIGRVPAAARELQPCTAVWGEAEVRAGPPAIEVHQDLMLLPFLSTPVYDQDPSWGVYGADGWLIDAAALRRGGGGGLIGQSLQSPVAIESLEQADGDLVYGGVIIAHYGHFICTSLSRLWWLAEEPLGRRKVVFHGARDIGDELAFPYISACLSRLGLTRETAAVIRKPLRTHRLTVPRPSFEEQSFVTPEFRKLCHHIGRPWWRPRAGAQPPPVYLSKIRLESGVSRLQDERVIEEILRAGGVDIVYPERLSFADQIGLFSQERTILGSTGSAFHTSIFAPPCSRLICVSPSPTLNSNLRLLDEINHARTRYLFPVSGSEDQTDAEGFAHSWTFKKPTLVAEELLDLAFSNSI